MTLLRTALACAVSLIVLMSSTARADTPPELLGTWEYTAPGGATLSITLDKDGSAKMDAAPLKYTVQGDKLSMIDGPTITAYKFTAAGDTLKLSGGDLDREITFHRKAEVKKGILGGKLKALDTPASSKPAAEIEAKPAPAAKTIQGTWKANDGSMLEFTADTMIFNGSRLPYKTSGASLHLNDGALEWQYKVDGDTLQLSMSGETQTLTRVGAAPVVPDAKNAAAAKGNGSYLGSWDTASGTLTLRADGTGRLGDKEGTYTMKNGKLRLEGGGQWVEMPARMEGDSLILGENPSQKLERAGVAGVWVGSEADVDPTNALVITQYLVLYSDGGVGFTKTELGASRQQVSEMLEKFSSFRTSPATQRKIYGHWKADGNRINIEWQGMRNNGTCAGSFDLSKMKMSLPNVGILHEGASVEFTRQ
jgi:hypothetical protein